MRLFRFWLVAVGLGVSAANVSASDSSRICVAPWKPTADLPPDRWIRGGSYFTFSGKGMRPQRSTAGKQLVISDVPRRFRLLVSLDGKPMESFLVDTRSYPGGKACMWLYFPYVTWQLGPYVDGNNGCRCFNDE